MEQVNPKDLGCSVIQLRLPLPSPPSPSPSTHLVLSRAVHHLLVADLIHELEALQRLLHIDANVLLVQRAGAVAVVKVEQTLVLVHPEGREV